MTCQRELTANIEHCSVAQTPKREELTDELACMERHSADWMNVFHIEMNVSELMNAAYIPVRIEMLLLEQRIAVFGTRMNANAAPLAVNEASDAAQEAVMDETATAEGVAAEWADEEVAAGEVAVMEEASTEAAAFKPVTTEASVAEPVAVETETATADVGEAEPFMAAGGDVVAGEIDDVTASEGDAPAAIKESVAAAEKGRANQDAAAQLANVTDDVAVEASADRTAVSAVCEAGTYSKKYIATKAVAEKAVAGGRAA
ncbi:hypothetical protein Tcan_07373 [Toxocara canis]|uniref:Uncharacterized protein n=1 Tax=Toxocara canis TaxID=6265 RepID=A0A0B2UUL7_TOXCA|nr:hypothetical protein Tcan_07373 [Toxocara canis]